MTSLVIKFLGSEEEDIMEIRVLDQSATVLQVLEQLCAGNQLLEEFEGTKFLNMYKKKKKKQPSQLPNHDLQPTTTILLEGQHYLLMNYEDTVLDRGMGMGMGMDITEDADEQISRYLGLQEENIEEFVKEIRKVETKEAQDVEPNISDDELVLEMSQQVTVLEQGNSKEEHNSGVDDDDERPACGSGSPMEVDEQFPDDAAQHQEASLQTTQEIEMQEEQDRPGQDEVLQENLLNTVDDEDDDDVVETEQAKTGMTDVNLQNDDIEETPEEENTWAQGTSNQIQTRQQGPRRHLRVVSSRGRTNRPAARTGHWTNQETTTLINALPTVFGDGGNKGRCWQIIATEYLQGSRNNIQVHDRIRTLIEWMKDNWRSEKSPQGRLQEKFEQWYKDYYQ